ncbi:MAG: rhamnulokinase [Parabacteroides sp.]|nr:rhamnulokinase [Parabacteroides sp.]
MRKYNFLAFDIGATSGRAILGTLAGDSFEMKEINRFPNAMMEMQGKFFWNIYKLFDHLKESLVICAQQHIALDSIGIDTWGVDFGYVSKDGTILGLPRAYRDPYTVGAPEKYFERLSREEVYQSTGIQIMNFNSLFQLFAAKEQDFGPLKAADEILFMPDLLSYLLTGIRVCEYTDASTSQILNPKTKAFEKKLLEVAGVPSSIMHEPLIMPGTVIGTLTEALAKETGVGKVPVIAVTGHDTASAVAAVPALDQGFAYLSSGTWSLMGIETEEPIINEASFRNNFTNEGGLDGTIRFLKNITGMWLLEQCRKEWKVAGRDYNYSDIDRMANEARAFSSVVNPDDARFANPDSMTNAIISYCKESGQSVPSSDAEFIRCIFRSLAFRYKEVLDLLITMSPFPIHRLHVIGGGSKNFLLNTFTANIINMPIVSGPSEATAIGNCMLQARAAGLVSDRWDMRRLISKFVSPTVFTPSLNNDGEEAYKYYLSITSKM